MSAELVVHGIGTGRTFRVLWALEELELSYDVRPVLSRSGETQTPGFLALNPRGKIPVLVHGDFVLAESGAIVTYLGDTFGAERGFVPAPLTPERARYHEWALFILTELDATTLYVLRRHQDLAQIYGEAPAAVASAREYFQRQIGVAADELRDGRPYLLGDAFTAADVLLVSCLDWASFYGEPLAEPLDGYRERLAKRDAYARARAVNFPPEVLAALAAQRPA